MNYHTKALLSLAAESPGVILMKNSTVRKPNNYKLKNRNNEVAASQCKNKHYMKLLIQWKELEVVCYCMLVTTEK